jgi:DNA-binding CsgD family transcriptional regulator
VDGETHARERNAETDPAIRCAETAAWLGLEAMNALSVGVVVVDHRGFVAFANAKGAELLERRTIFRGVAPLALCDAGSHDALRRALAAAKTRVSGALRLRDRTARAVVSAVVVPLGASDRATPDSEATILLAMNELFPTGAIPNVWLSQLFGLTPTESSVTNWLVTGRPIEEYAQDRGVSLATVRSQIKTVLAKTGMSRQVQLVAALARLPIESPEI